MRSSKSSIRYKVSEPLQAVKLTEHPGSSLRDPTGTLVQIPAEVIIEIEGGVAQSGLINIPVSYTHLDVYKRQPRNCQCANAGEPTNYAAEYRPGRCSGGGAFGGLGVLVMDEVFGAGVLRHQNGNISIAEPSGPQCMQRASDRHGVAKHSKNCRIFS